MGGAGGVASDQVGPGGEGAADASFDLFALLDRGFAQDPAGYFIFVTRMTDAEPKSPIVWGSQLGVDVAQTVVTGMSAAEFEFGFSRR